MAVLTESPTIERRKDVYALLLIGVLCLIAYSNSFHGEFTFDDDRLIRFNFALRDLSLWRDTVRFEAFRPLTLLTYALNFQISQKDPWSYHVFNFLCHLLATGLFYAFVRRINANVLLCFFSSALFAVHPLNTEAVSYIASRPILLCAIFYFSALICFDNYVRNAGWWSLTGFFICLLLGFASKEEAAMIPFAAFLYNFILFGAESARKHVKFHVFTLALVIAALLFRIMSLAENIPAESVGIYFATEASVWFRYLGLAIFPIPLNVDHAVSLLHLTDVWFVVSFAAAIVMVVLFLLIRKRSPWIAFFGVWFFLNLMPSSSFVPLNDFMAEHRVYLSLSGFCACVASLIGVRKNGSRLLVWCLTGLLFFYSFATWKRNFVWQSNLTLWADAVEKSPEKFRPHVNFAFTLFQHRAYKEAAEEYVLARSLNPTEPRIHTGLGFTLMEMGNSNSAEQSFRTALQIDPNYIDAKTGLGVLRYRAGQYPEALEYLVPSYPYRRESAQLIAMICDSYLALGHPEKALPILNETARQNLRFHRATMLVQKDIKQARAELQAIVAEKQ